MEDKPIKIKITKDITDLKPYARPKVGWMYEVKDVKKAGYNPCGNKGYVISVGSTDVMILANECEIVKERKRK